MRSVRNDELRERDLDMKILHADGFLTSGGR